MASSNSISENKGLSNTQKLMLSDEPKTDLKLFLKDETPEI